MKPSEVILITGALYGAQLSLASAALAEGIRSRGKTVSIAVPGATRSHSFADQFGTPADWDFGFDVVLVEFGEYLGEDRFRHGVLNDVAFTRTLFFTPVAEPSVAHSIELTWEKEQRDQTLEYLQTYLPGPVHLCRPSLLRVASTEHMLVETNNEVVGYLEQGLPIPELLQQKRQIWRGQGGLDRVPKLERALW